MEASKFRNPGNLTVLLLSLVMVASIVAVPVSANEQAEEPANSLIRLKVDFPEAREFKSGEMITRLYGTAIGNGNSPENTAEIFVRDFSGIWGVRSQDLTPAGFTESTSSVQPLMYRPETGDYKFSLVKYDQYLAGIPVFGSQLKLLVRNEPGFPLVLASSSLRDLGSFKADLAAAGRQSAAAVDMARQEEPGLTSFSSQETVIWAGDEGELDTPRLAVKFFGQSDEPQAFLFIADAITGEIIRKYDLTYNATVSGRVMGMATEPNAADICNPESLVPIPYAAVSSAYGMAYTDSTGNFEFTTGHAGQFTLYSYLDGLYFDVSSLDFTPNSVVSASVNPPDTATLTHNGTNTSEYLRSQVNAYYYANQIRDWVMRYNPSYPGVFDQQDFEVQVNMYCECGAGFLYDPEGSVIRFCASGASCSNMAFQPVIQHEYGHYLQVMAGIMEQGDYHEGMADCLAVIYADQPELGLGRYLNCSEYDRTADNNFQYPCTGEIHYCGQLLSGCIWSTRNELVASNIQGYQELLADLTINSILLHGNAFIDPSITIDFLVLDDDDASLANGTPHYNEIAAGFAAHNMAPPRLKYLATIPERNANDVGRTAPILATFDADMDATSINASTVKVYSRSHGYVAGNVFYAPPSKTVIFQPDQPLDHGDLVTVTLGGAILDATQNPLMEGFGYSWSFTVENCSNGAFGGLSNYSLSCAPNAFYAGDLNGDQAIDIAACDSGTGVVSVLYNNGSGGLGNEALINLPSGSMPTDIKIADFDGDGDLDLAVACFGTNKVMVYERDGLGTFVMLSELSTTYAPRNIHPGDLDNDGDVDLVVNFIDVAAGKSRYADLYNDGSAVFTPGSVSGLEYAKYEDVTLGDMNNDGELDPVFALTSLRRVKMIVKDFDGLYNDTVLRTAVCLSALTLHDLTGNASLDIASVALNSDSLLIINGQGLFTFGPYVYGATGQEPRAIVSNDFDGDGDIDLAFANRLDDNVTFFWNAGEGNFSTQTSFAVGDGPYDMIAADFDNDGSVDIATANVDNPSISILFNYGTPDAPTLYSPVDGKELPSPASPKLNCNDVPYGIFYWFQVDNNSDFSSPIAQQSWNSVSEWTVPVSLGPGVYYWRASAATSCGFGGWSVVRHIHVVSPPDTMSFVIERPAGSSLPATFALYSAYPNPFNPTTTIEYDLPKACRVTLEVFNVLGQSVARLVNEDQVAGHYQVVWDAGSVASGVYLYRLSAEDFVETRKMTLLK